MANRRLRRPDKPVIEGKPGRMGGGGGGRGARVKINLGSKKVRGEQKRRKELVDYWEKTDFHKKIMRGDIEGAMKGARDERRPQRKLERKRAVTQKAAAKRANAAGARRKGDKNTLGGIARRAALGAGTSEALRQGIKKALDTNKKNKKPKKKK